MSRILVIEDDYDVKNTIMMSLELNGHKVYGEGNGWDGLQKARSIFPDLIICDIDMPNLDGFGVLEKLRSDPLTETIPFIFLTGWGEREDVRRGMEKGADDYITKPFTFPELMKAVEARLAKEDLWKKKLQSTLEEFRKNVNITLPHELRTPLTGIIGAASLLKDERINLEKAEIKKLGEIIFSSGERLNRLVERHLLYSELEEPLQNPQSLEAYRKKRKALQRESILTTRDCISQVVASLAEKAHRTEDLKIDLDDSEAGIFFEDLREIAWELTDNAFKFSAAGTPVHITSRGDEHTYVLSITDNGRGVPPDRIAAMGAFVQFERKKYEQQGLGLGIAIVKRLLAIYQGKMVVESIPTRSTTVTIEIPH